MVGILNRVRSVKLFLFSLLIFTFSAFAFFHATADIQLSEGSNLSITTGTTMLIPQCREDVSFEDYIVQLSSVSVLKNMTASEFFVKCNDPTGIIELADTTYLALNRTGDICGELDDAFTTCQAALSYCEELKQADACTLKEEKLMQQCLAKFELNGTERHCAREFQRNRAELEALCGEELWQRKPV